MRFNPFLFFGLLVLLFSSCKEDPVELNNQQVIDHVYQFIETGNQPYNVMTESGDHIYVFSSTESGDYLLYAADPLLQDIRRKQYPFPVPGFIPHKLEALSNGNLLLAGSMNGYPAWALTDTNASAGLYFMNYADSLGRFYDAMALDNALYLCGEITRNNSRDVIVLKVDYSGNHLDTLIFGTAVDDGGVDLELFNAKIHLLSYSYGLALGDRDAMVTELSDDLEPGISKVFGGTGYEQPEKLLAHKDQLYLCGHTTSFNDPMHDAWFLCLKPDLSIRWEKHVHLNGHEGADHMSLTKDGHLVWCGYGMMPPDLGYWGMISADGQVLHQEKRSHYQQFNQIRAYGDYILILGNRSDLGLHPALHRISYPQ